MLVTLQILIVAESGIQVKRLREYIVGNDEKKVVTLQINIVAGIKNTLERFL